MLNEPLGLPKGSVRAIITIGVVAAVVVATFIKAPEVKELLAPIATMVLGYYFGNRSEFANKE